MMMTMHRMYTSWISLSCAWLYVAATTGSVVSAAESSSSSGNTHPTPPLVRLPETWLPPLSQEHWVLKDVTACCVEAKASTESSSDNTCDDQEETCESPADDNTKRYETVTIGHMPQFTSDQALQVLDAAVEAWKGGTGVWPTMSLQDRITALETFFETLATTVRDDMIDALQYEIGKNRADATSEFDRTVSFFRQCVQVLQEDLEFKGTWQSVGSTQAFVRRAAFGIVLGLAPANYPLNESYAMLLPALLAGNIVILKIPATGGLVHLLTMQALKDCLPPGTIHFVAGSGRVTMPPLMASGKIDGLAFIGGSNAADKLIQAHPHPHRLKVFLQLEGNNMALFLPNLFDDAALLEHAYSQVMLGALSYNGQRCTALKLVQVPVEQAETVAEELARRVEALPIGLSTEDGVLITPLPNQGRIAYMQELLEDAVKKGARVMNENGGTIVGGSESTLMVPAVLYPVTPDMRVYQEEQFGPLVPVAAYESIDDVIAFGRDGIYAQQVSLFFSDADAQQAAALVDAFGAIFGKINLNGQCARSPDTLPFSGRRSSALGVMSVLEALREFSVPTVVAYKQASSLQTQQDGLARQLDQASTFLQPLEPAASTSSVE